MIDQPLWKQLWTLPNNNMARYASYHKSYEDAVQFAIEEHQVQEAGNQQMILDPIYRGCPVGTPEQLYIEPYGIRSKLNKTIGVVVDL